MHCVDTPPKSRLQGGVPFLGVYLDHQPKIRSSDEAPPQPGEDTKVLAQWLAQSSETLVRTGEAKVTSKFQKNIKNHLFITAGNDVLFKVSAFTTNTKVMIVLFFNTGELFQGSLWNWIAKNQLQGFFEFGQEVLGKCHQRPLRQLVAVHQLLCEKDDIVITGCVAELLQGWTRQTTIHCMVLWVRAQLNKYIMMVTFCHPSHVGSYREHLICSGVYNENPPQETPGSYWVISYI